jgi:hypothetical protein
MRGFRFVAVAAVATAGIGLLSPGAARADTFVPLPDGHIDGPSVHIDSVGEKALISPSLAMNGAGRTVWVSGDVTARLKTPPGVVGPNNGPDNEPGTNDSSTHGASAMTVGYLVGCQVGVGSLVGQFGAVITANAPGLAGSLTVPLTPGQVKWVRIDEIDMVKSGVYHFDYQDQEMQIQGCAGYAQARQFVVVEVVGPDYAKTTLYGKPFSIG